MIVGGVDILFIYFVGMVIFVSLVVDGVGFLILLMENLGNVFGIVYYMGIVESIDFGVVGKICMIDCGNILFYDKVNNCENLGGIGVVIINNEVGMLYVILGDINDIMIFVVGVVFEDCLVLFVSIMIDIIIGISDYGFMSGILMVIFVVLGIVVFVWLNYFECIGIEICDVLKVIV